MSHKSRDKKRSTHCECSSLCHANFGICLVPSFGTTCVVKSWHLVDLGQVHKLRFQDTGKAYLCTNLKHFPAAYNSKVQKTKLIRWTIQHDSGLQHCTAGDAALWTPCLCALTATALQRQHCIWRTLTRITSTADFSAFLVKDKNCLLYTSDAADE